jgi:hypothetical protein
MVRPNGSVIGRSSDAGLLNKDSVINVPVDAATVLAGNGASPT